MSSTSNGTGYMVTISVGPAEGGTLTFGTDTGVNDALVLALVAAINGLAWPGGAKPAAFV